MRSIKTCFSRMITTPISTWVWFIVTILTIAIFTTLGPAEASLGNHIRIVYLHGAWVWASIAAFLNCGSMRRYRFIHTQTSLPLLVKRFRANRFILLDHLSSPVALGDAIELERLIPGRASMEISPGFCHQRFDVANWTEPG